jgi:hypothetical protein
MDSAVKLLGSRQPLEPIEQELLAGFEPYAQLVQCLDVEPTDNLGRQAGNALLALVLLREGVAVGEKRSQRWLVRRALKRARLAAFLTAPRHVLFVAPEEVSRVGGKLQRRHARKHFPYCWAEWPTERRARLVTAPVFPGDLWRMVARLRAESRAFRRPVWALAWYAWRWLRRWLSPGGLIPISPFQRDPCTPSRDRAKALEMEPVDL